MHMLGKANWRIPAALDRILPRLALEGEAEEPAGAGTTAETGTSEIRTP
jgi:hypothetical protein